METIKKFKSTIVFCLVLIVAAGFIFKPSGIEVGSKAPELAYKNPDGEIMKLSDLKGKVVLIDFWASWCRPCRHENPVVVAAYEKYKDAKWNLKKSKGFAVFSYSLDKNNDAWKRAIEQDKLTWEYHVSDLKGWGSEGAEKYGVVSIPTNYLIDGQGNILAKNLRGNALDEALQKYVKE